LASIVLCFNSGIDRSASGRTKVRHDRLDAPHEIRIAQTARGLEQIANLDEQLVDARVAGRQTHQAGLEAQGVFDVDRTLRRASADR